MYTLIIYIFAGALAQGDSVALDHIDGFTTKEACVTAAKETESFVKMSSKNHRFVCVKK